MKKYELRIPPRISEFLRHSHPDLRRRLRLALEAIQTDPMLGKPLREPLQGFYSFRVSNYRIVYRIKHSEVIIEIVDIDRSKIVYEKLVMLFQKMRS